MSLAQTRLRLGRVPRAPWPDFPGFRLAFNKPMYDDPTHAYANIIPADDHVLGVLYDCTPADMTHLDIVEGVAQGHYEQQPVSVEVNGESIDAIAYVGCAGRVGGWLPTTHAYLETILEGARDNDFPEAEVARILSAAGRT